MSQDKTPHASQLDLTFEPTPPAHADGDRLPDGETEPQNEPAEDEPAEDEPAEAKLKRLVEEQGLGPDVVDYISHLAVKVALASLHREALMNERETHGLLTQCYWDYGAEGCFHLCGILEANHLGEPGEGWEVLQYMRPQSDWKPFQAIARTWANERSEHRRAMDRNREDMVWEQEFMSLWHHPEVDTNGLTFLESMKGRPKHARELVESGTLLRTVLARQQLASDYAEHAVLTLGDDPIVAQREAEREYLLLPDEVTDPNLDK